MAFIATSDAHGECDSSFRAGPPGFIRVIDEKTVMWPEYKGNGVMASMGNISENGYVGMLFVDFFETAVGLHVNGKATIVDNAAVEAFGPLFDRLPFATAVARDRRRQEDAGALGRRLDRRGLHPLLQAHPDASVRARGRRDRPPRGRRLQGQERRPRVAGAATLRGRARRSARPRSPRRSRAGADALRVGPPPAAAARR